MAAVRLLCGPHQLGEAVRIERGAADEAAVDVFHGEEEAHVLGLHRAAVEDAHLVCRLLAKELCQGGADGSADLLGLLWGGGAPGADGPDGLVGHHALGRLRGLQAGKPGALDYPLRLVELNALEQGSAELYKGSWYDLTNETFRASWMEFARALVQGDILVSDLYSNTQVMTGETLAGLGSSAAILYYNDFVTYPDNTTEPTDLLLAPLPHAAGTATPLMPQAGVGLCAFKTTDQKAEAAAVFLRWLTEQQRNLEFAADTGYMPVSSAAFDAIADYPFEQQSYQRLYDVYNEMRIQNTPLSEPGIVGYHAKAKTLYDSLRQRQKDYPQRLADGETLEALAEETWQLLCDNA